MKNIVSGLAYFVVTGLALVIVLMIIATLNGQLFKFTEPETQNEDPELTKTMSENSKNQGTSEDSLGSEASSNKNNESDQNKTDTSNQNNAVSTTNGSDGNYAQIAIDNAIDYAANEHGDLELPVNGATGYASVSMYVRQSPDTSSDIRATLYPGNAFLIRKEDGEYWEISVVVEGTTIVGWVPHILCMINLPDVIPSIIYKITNVYSSEFRSCGEDIPGITGERLYPYSDREDGRVYNQRLRDYEYIVPILYSSSKKVYLAQLSALAMRDSLVIYDAFRPLSAQGRVYNELRKLANKYQYIMDGINGYPWNMSWFIAGGISNHQIGYAMDVSLAKFVKDDMITKITGKYKYTRIQNYDEYYMPTLIHELSMASAAFARPVEIYSETAWKRAEPSILMEFNRPAQRLQEYCTDAGFTPLASEWWHFNDLGTWNRIKSYKYSDGNYEINVCLSQPPK